MVVPDVNVLLNAYFADAPFHRICTGELAQLAGSGEPLVLLDQVRIGFLRISTLQRLYTEPVSLQKSLGFLQAVEAACSTVSGPTPPDPEPFYDLLLKTNARGNFVPDLYLASVAIYLGAELVSLDDDFGRIPGLRWRKPGARR